MLTRVHFHTTPVVSGITGRQLSVNHDHSKYAVLPGFNPTALTAVRQDWDAHIEEVRHRQPGQRLTLKHVGIGPADQAIAASCLAAADLDSFAQSLEDVIEASEVRDSGFGRARRHFELLVLLWKHGFIAHPAGLISKPGGTLLPEVTECFYGPLAGPLAEMMNETEAFSRVYAGANEPKATRTTRLLLFACGGVQEIGDIDTNAIDGLAPSLLASRRGRSTAACDMLHAMQVVAYRDQPDIERRLPTTYRPILNASRHTETNICTEEVNAPQTANTWVRLDTAPVESTITGRTLQVNYDARRYAILPEFTMARVAAARADWDSFATKLGSRTKQGISSKTQLCLDACFRARTRETFAAAVELLLTRRSSKPRRNDREGYMRDGLRPGEAARITEVLVLFWKHGLIAFPAGEVWGATKATFKTTGVPQEDVYGPLSIVMRSLFNSKRWDTQDRRVPRMIFLICAGIEEVGDLDTTFLKKLVPFAAAAEGGTHRQFPKSVNVLCDQLRAVQRHTYARDEVRLAKIPQSYRTTFRPPKQERSDPQFQWAKSLGPRVDSWREWVARHVASIPNRVTRRAEITAFNALLDYVHAHPDVPKQPLDYCRREYVPTTSFESFFRKRDPSAAHLTSTMRRVGVFFTAVLEEVMDEDGYIRAAYHNPHSPEDFATGSANRGQTHRTAIPVRYLRMMREIIEENDYAWPRTIRQDYIEWVNSETGKTETVWSPVRALFFLLRLQLPIRGMQARLLDSGEGDAEVYRGAEGWVPNTGRWAPKPVDDKKPMGFVRRIWDAKTRRWFNGVYITTNKTADRMEGFVETGYEIPWENPEILSIFTTVRDWQEKYNPSQRPMSRSELTDKSLSASDDVAIRLEKLHFLFRDAANGAYPLEPLSVGRLSSFWLRLVAELERRLAKQGVTNHDGSRISLITKWHSDGVPGGSVFDPHSLRVAGLTALAAAGVPMNILSEFVAGHATVLMTIYYQKWGASEITRLLDDAAARMMAVEERQWAAYLKDHAVDLLVEMAAFNSGEGLSAVAAVQSGLWAPMDDGVCPNGGTKCAVGGPLVDTRKRIYAPVTGGPRNCVLCRFFVTGPAYLAGLVAKFNATAGEIREAVERVRELGAKRRALVKAAIEAEREARPFSQHRQLTRAEEELTKAEAGLDVLSQTWVAQLSLIRRCEALLEKRMSEQTDKGRANALVLNGTAVDLRISLEQCSEFDLWDRICESSEFFEGIDARLPALRRGRLFDTMLAREGRPAFFATLSDEQLLAVGNEAARLLRAQLGRTDLNDLMAGRRTLVDLGIGDLVEKLAEAAPGPVGISLTRPVGALPAPPAEAVPA